MTIRTSYSKRRVIEIAQEKNFENKIKLYLKSHGCYFVKYFANRMTKVGVPDILACINGSFVGIEVKSSTGKPSELQIHNVRAINECGGYAVIVSPEQWEYLKILIGTLENLDFKDARQLVDSINAKFF